MIYDLSPLSLIMHNYVWLRPTYMKLRAAYYMRNYRKFTHTINFLIFTYLSRLDAEMCILFFEDLKQNEIAYYKHTETL